MQTKLTELLGIKYPILQGGMAFCSEAPLVAAVSNAGGAGIIGANCRTPEWIREEIRKTKELTDKPFGVNFMLMSANIGEIMEVVCQEKVAFVTTGAGNPMLVMDKMHAAGIKVIPVVPNVKLAQRMEQNGADAVVVEGLEAGGHIGSQTTMALMENVLSLVKNIPVIIGGGISDGRAIAAALLMGAAGVQIGSRFLLTEECNIHNNAKTAILNATDTDSIAVGCNRKQRIRFLNTRRLEEYLNREKNGFTELEFLRLSDETTILGMGAGDLEQGTIMVGQSLNVLNNLKPTAAVIQDLMAECEATLKNAAKLLK